MYWFISGILFMTINTMLLGVALKPLFAKESLKTVPLVIHILLLGAVPALVVFRFPAAVYSFSLGIATVLAVFALIAGFIFFRSGGSRCIP